MLVDQIISQNICISVDYFVYHQQIFFCLFEKQNKKVKLPFLQTNVAFFLFINNISNIIKFAKLSSFQVTSKIMMFSFIPEVSRTRPGQSCFSVCWFWLQLLSIMVLWLVLAFISTQTVVFLRRSWVWLFLPSVPGFVILGVSRHSINMPTSKGKPFSYMVSIH